MVNYFSVVGFILDPHYLLSLTCISVMHDVLRGLGIPYPCIYPAWPFLVMMSLGG